MKRFIILSIVLLPMLSFAQMAFETGDWEAVLSKAKQENKIVFVDFYTTWCGPCKLMAKEVFPLQQVGEFYNANFINYKLDAEKGEGIALASKYGVVAYPTYIFTDADGNFLHQAVGAFSANEFIEHGKAALDPSKQLANILNSDKAVTKAEMPQLLRKLSQEYLPYNDKYKAYINSLSNKELVTQETYNLMLELSRTEEDDFTFNKIYKNKKGFASIVGEKVIDNYFYRQFLYKLANAQYYQEPIQPILDKIKSLGFNFTDKIATESQLSQAMYQGKGYDEFVENAKLFIKKYIPNNDPEEIYSAVFMETIKFSNASPKLMAYALQLANELIAANYKVATINALIGRSYAETGDLKTALDYYQKSSDYSQKNGLEDIAEASVTYIKSRLDDLKKGDYTLNGKGFDAYNGMAFKMGYSSPTDLGEFEELEGVTIKDGKFSYSGHVNTPMHAIWAIFDGDDFLASGNIVLDPGTFTIVMDEKGDALVENSTYNFHVFNSWKTNQEYIAAQDALQAFVSNPDVDYDDPETNKAFFKLNVTVNQLKEDYLIDIFNNNPDPIIKALAVFEGNLYYDNLDDTSGSERLAKLEQLIPDYYLVKTMRHNKEHSEALEAMRNSVEVGNTVKTFAAVDHDGNTVDLKDVLKKNNYVLIEFWASWCGPCRGAIPHLKEAYKKYKEKGFEIVSFSIDHKKEAWDKAFYEENIPWIDLSDLLARKSPIAEMYGVTGVPASYLIDKNGQILGAEMRYEKLDNTLKEVFGY